MRRREVLIGAGAALLASGCDRIVSSASRALGADLPSTIAAPRESARSHARVLLDRAAFGPWPGDVERVKAMGADAWIEEQLHPEAIDDAACAVRAGWIDVANVPADLVFEMRPEEVERELVTHAVLRAVYSRRQLAEVLTSFWTDHFNVHIGKDLCRHLVAVYDRDVIRPRVLGRFSDLLRAVALSPAMLVYLDGRENAVRRAGDAPNENYARELLELHALGVHGGYTQRDVMEAARCLSGWTVLEEGAPGSVRFDPERHDDGAKTVLGRRIAAGGGARDVDRLLDAVTAHPSCARHVSGALARFFVGSPSDALLGEATRTFRHTDGDLRSVVRTILRSPELARSDGARIKRPFQFAISALRAVAADTHARGDLQAHLAAMGQVPYAYPTPDGYPREGEAYLGAMVPRWRFVLALARGELDDTRVDVERLSDALGGDPLALARHVLGRELSPLERSALEDETDPAVVLASALSSPGFARC